MSRHFRIHPAIGTARMGNSPEHFIGPETPGVPANIDASGAFKSFRDSSGRVLRQGARFRVFEYVTAADGTVTASEVKLDGSVVDIEWRVHLANRKASFFAFNGQSGADDTYRARTQLPPTTQIYDDPARANLRNADVPVGARATTLEIDPGEQTISHRSPQPVELSNTNPSIPIKSLGTLRIDNGQLIVLGGYGESNSTKTPPTQISDYANNDTWFDDASDGSVKARVHLSSGDFFDADPAWVFVGPPDFAPGVGNVVSLFDTLWDTAVRELPEPAPLTPMLRALIEQQRIWASNAGRSLSGFKPSFTRDVYPLLKRAFAARSVHISTIGSQNYHHKLVEWDLLSTLDPNRAADAEDARILIFDKKMRDPDSDVVEWDKMPRGLGDNYADPDTEANGGTRKASAFLSVTRIQYAMLREWRLGNFVNDWPGAEAVLTANPSPTPDELDQAATENSVGGPFFPGIEVSWLIRSKELFAEPFRFKTPREPEGSGATLPIKIGALDFRSGFFSQQMALPWQADFYDCHREFFQDPDGNAYWFMWWTAQRPDYVFPSGSQDKVPTVRWVREFDKQAQGPLDPGDPDAADNDQNLERFNQMQKRWFELKFVTVKKGDHFEEES